MLEDGENITTPTEALYEGCAIFTGNLAMTHCGRVQIAFSTLTQRLSSLVTKHRIVEEECTCGRACSTSVVLEVIVITQQNYLGEQFVLKTILWYSVVHKLWRGTLPYLEVQYGWRKAAKTSLGLLILSGMRHCTVERSMLMWQSLQWIWQVWGRHPHSQVKLDTEWISELHQQLSRVWWWSGNFHFLSFVSATVYLFGN